MNGAGPVGIVAPGVEPDRCRNAISEVEAAKATDAPSGWSSTVNTAGSGRRTGIGSFTAVGSLAALGDLPWVHRRAVPQVRRNGFPLLPCATGPSRRRHTQYCLMTLRRRIGLRSQTFIHGLGPEC